jgi:hypothetical protein
MVIVVVVMVVMGVHTTPCGGPRGGRSWGHGHGFECRGVAFDHNISYHRWNNTQGTHPTPSNPSIWGPKLRPGPLQTSGGGDRASSLTVLNGFKGVQAHPSGDSTQGRSYEDMLDGLGG